MNLSAEGWEIFYADGSVFSSKDSFWDEILDKDVVVLIIWHGYHIPGVRQKTIAAGGDYYYYGGEDIWGCTNNLEDIPVDEFKKGVWVTDDEFDEIYKIAFEKLDF